MRTDSTPANLCLASVGIAGGFHSNGRGLPDFRTGEGWRWLFCLRSRQPHVEAADAAGLNEFIRTPRMARVEAVLVVAEGALAARRIAQLATLCDTAEANELIRKLNDAYDGCGSAFRIERVATGYQMLTRPRYSPWLGKLHRRQSDLKLSAPAMETLTLVAYQQPVTRADIEAVRGVQSAEMLKQLMERGLVRIAGEEDSLGRPYLYETTRKFQELFGLRTLDDLPGAQTLRRRPQPSDESRQSAETDKTDPPAESAGEVPSSESLSASTPDDSDDDQQPLTAAA